MNENAMLFTAIACLSYLAGSMPTAYLAGRLKGVDIRREGSGNSGATNALRVLGAPSAVAVLAVDAGKGILSVLVIAPLASRAFGVDAGTMSDAARQLAGVVAGAACVMGHVFPVWLRFKGGKGVATGAAVVAALAPAAAGVSLAVFIVVAAASRYVSLASLAAAAALPVAYATLYRGGSFSAPLFAFFAAASALVVVMHRKNIARLAGGTENRLGRPGGKS